MTCKSGDSDYLCSVISSSRLIDLWAGIELSNQFPHIPIYLEFSDGSIAEKWIQSEVSGTWLIYSTGMFKDVLTEEKLLN